MRARAADWVDRFRYHLGAAAVAAGMALAAAPARAALVVGLLGIATLAGARRPRIAAACALLLVLGAGAGELRLRAIDGPGERLAPWTSIDERAVLLERPRSAGARTHASVRLSGRAKLLAVAEDRGVWPKRIEPGVELRVRGLLKPPLRAEGDSFDWPAHLRRRGIAYELQLTSVEATGARRGGIAGAVDSSRRRAEGALSAGLPPDKAALMRGMVLGQDEDIDSLTKDDWRDAGLAHLLRYTA